MKRALIEGLNVIFISSVKNLLSSLPGKFREKTVDYQISCSVSKRCQDTFWQIQLKKCKRIGDFEMILSLQLFITQDTEYIPMWFNFLLRVLYVYILFRQLNPLQLFIHANINYFFPMNSSHINSGIQEREHTVFWIDVNFTSFLENWKIKFQTTLVSAINTLFSNSLRLFNSGVSCSLGSIKDLKTFFFCFQLQNQDKLL